MQLAGIAEDGRREIVDGSISGGTNTSHTIVVEALQTLLAAVPAGATPKNYEEAVVTDNILGKAAAGARERTFRRISRARSQAHASASVGTSCSGSGYSNRRSPSTVLFTALRSRPLRLRPHCTRPWIASSRGCRRRVKEQQAFIGRDEFGELDLSYELDGAAPRVMFCQESVRFAQERGSDNGSEAGPASDAPLPAPEPADLKEPEAAPREYGAGDVIDDRFEVIESLGKGGFSKVYRVLDQLENEERALKLFRSASGYDAVRREISALRRVRHPNVVQVYWADRTATGQWFLVTEFVDGEPLELYARGDRSLRDREAVDVAMDILNALVAIHPDSARLAELDEQKREGELSEAEFAELLEMQDSGLVHRDIKPENVILTRRGAKLLDFNIASRVGDPVETQSGTPPFQAPDADLTRWDVSTDLFAVGVLLYELLCNGSHPYPHAKPMLDEEVLDPRGVRPDLPGPLADFLIKACASRREDRFGSTQEMKSGLVGVRDAS